MRPRRDMQGRLMQKVATTGNATLIVYDDRPLIDYLLSALEDQSRNFLTRFAQQDTTIHKMMKQLCVSLARRSQVRFLPHR